MYSSGWCQSFRRSLVGFQNKAMEKQQLKRKTFSMLLTVKCFAIIQYRENVIPAPFE